MLDLGPQINQSCKKRACVIKRVYKCLDFIPVLRKYTRISYHRVLNIKSSHVKSNSFQSNIINWQVQKLFFEFFEFNEWGFKPRASQDFSCNHGWTNLAFNMYFLKMAALMHNCRFLDGWEYFWWDSNLARLDQRQGLLYLLRHQLVYKSS